MVIMCFVQVECLLRLSLPVIASPVHGSLPDDPVYGRRIGLVEECVEYLLSYGGVDGVAAPLRTPHVKGGVLDVPDCAVGVGGGHLELPPRWFGVISVAPNVERIHQPPRPLLDI